MNANKNALYFAQNNDTINVVLPILLRAEITPIKIDNYLELPRELTLIPITEMTMTNAIYANATVSITDLRRNPGAVIEEAGDAPVAVLNHNRATAYLVPASAFEALMETIEDMDLAEIVRSRRNGKTRKVSLDEL